MLLEGLKYLTTPCPEHLRRLGYLSELIGLQARYKRCHGAWAGHLENCRMTILEAADLCPDTQQVVILGSGLLNDIPLEDLSQRFERVKLVDILHMPQARRRAQKLRNVELIEVDITGIVEAVSQWMLQDALPTVSKRPLPLEGTDLVISACIASQLYHLPKEYLEKLGAGKDKIDAFAADLVTQHFDVLAQFRGVACLITEVSREVFDGGTALDKVDPLCGVPLPFPGKEWMWNIAPAPEIHSRYGQRLRMTGAIKQKMNEPDSKIR